MTDSVERVAEQIGLPISGLTQPSESGDRSYGRTDSTNEEGCNSLDESSTCVTRANEPVDIKWTERELLDRLKTRHSKVAGNGPEWAYMEHVRDRAGAFCNTTIDALALHLWPSRHHEVHAYEVKCSRADFRRELADGLAKSLPWRSWVEFFWIVAPKDVVPLTELPKEWGLLVPHATALRVAKPAVRLRSKPYGYNVAEPDIPRTLVASMLRAQVRNAAKVDGYWTAPGAAS